MIEKTADDSDLASQREAQHNEQALLKRQQQEQARIRATETALATGAFDGMHCVVEDCGEPLPATRIIEHRMTCTACQARKELENKQRGIR